MLTDEQFWDYWRNTRCTKHDLCFSTSDLTLNDLYQELDRCTDTCPCWRHHILRIAASRAISPHLPFGEHR